MVAQCFKTWLIVPREIYLNGEQHIWLCLVNFKISFLVAYQYSLQHQVWSSVVSSMKSTHKPFFCSYRCHKLQFYMIKHLTASSYMLFQPVFIVSPMFDHYLCALPKSKTVFSAELNYIYPHRKKISPLFIQKQRRWANQTQLKHPRLPCFQLLVSRKGQTQQYLVNLCQKLQHPRDQILPGHSCFLHCLSPVHSLSHYPKTDQLSLCLPLVLLCQ